MFAHVANEEINVQAFLIGVAVVMVVASLVGLIWLREMILEWAFRLVTAKVRGFLVEAVKATTVSVLAVVVGVFLARQVFGGENFPFELSLAGGVAFVAGTILASVAGVLLLGWLERFLAGRAEKKQLRAERLGDVSAREDVSPPPAKPARPRRSWFAGLSLPRLAPRRSATPLARPDLASEQEVPATLTPAAESGRIHDMNQDQDDPGVILDPVRRSGEEDEEADATPAEEGGPTPPARSRWQWQVPEVDLGSMFRWVALVVGGFLLLAVLLGVGGWFYMDHANRVASEEAVAAANNLVQARSTANAVISGDPKLAKACPNGWDDACLKALTTAVPPIPLPACTAAEGTVAKFVMDDACVTAFVGLGYRRVEAEQATPTRLEADVMGYLWYQEEVFQSGDSARITALITDPRLKSEVILRHWTDQGLSYKILANPALSSADAATVFGQIQASCRYDAMPYLMLNPALDGHLRGMWLVRPQANPVIREQTILLGLQQPEVAPSLVHYLVDQAEDDAKLGDLVLWNILLKALANGDMPLARCHLSSDKDAEHKDYPVCGDAAGWDFVEQMKEMAEANSFPQPPDGWLKVRAACQYESATGRHSAGTVEAARKLQPKLPAHASHDAREPVAMELCAR